MNETAAVGVIGAGAMGTGIAQVALGHGHEVLLTDVVPGAAERARDAIANGLKRDVEKGRRTESDAASAMQRLTIVPSSGPAAFAGARMIIEAIVERLDVKQATFHALEQLVSDDCVLATNTSSLSVTSIASIVRRPERVIGVHFFNPPPLMPLVEIVPGLRTSDTVTQSARRLVDGWGKATVLATDTPGFIVNRIARPFYGESIKILEEGTADAPTIDWALRELGQFRMGPFLLMDFIGLDVNYAVTESVWAAMQYDARYRPSFTQRRLVEAGYLGRKTGHGFYDYAPDAPARQPVEDRALGLSIVRRVVAMLINEAVDAVRLRVASPADIETAMTKGVNYPKGLLAWGEELGLETVLAEIERLRDFYAEDRYRPSPLLRQMVRNGKRFFS